MKRCTLVSSLQMQLNSSQDISVTTPEFRASFNQPGIKFSQTLVDYKCRDCTMGRSSCHPAKDIQRRRVTRVPKSVMHSY